MKNVTCTITGGSPYSQSKHYSKDMIPGLQGENSPDYEKRTWRNRLHVNEDGNIFIPPMAFKNCLTEAAKYLSISVPGKGKATYTKYFEAGVLVIDPIILPIKAQDCEHEVCFVPSDGIRGSGKRVEKVFPVIRKWGGKLTILVFDQTVLNSFDASKKSVLEHVLNQAGLFIGVGRFRPSKNGFYGRFAVSDFKITEG